MNKMVSSNCQNNIDQLFDRYTKSGLIIRTNDGQTPNSIKDLQKYIKASWASKNAGGKGPNFFSFIQNSAPAYSSTILGLGSQENPSPPIVWYNHDYCQPQDGDGNYLDIEEYGKVVIGFILDPTKVRLGGATPFDADSNLRNSGVVPNNPFNSKTTTESLFALEKTFGSACTCSDNPGRWGNPIPSSQNNNPLINPFLLPGGNDESGLATDDGSSTALSDFLSDVCTTKGVWWDVLFSSGKFRNTDDANFINCLNTGMEIEAEAYPHNIGAQKFSQSDLSAFCVLREESTKELPSDFYERYITPYISTASAENGWVKFDDASKMSSFEIVNVWMPDVPVDGTSSAGALLSSQLEAIASKKSLSLCRSDFSNF